MLSKPAITSIKIHELMQTRWSPRAFDPNKSVLPDNLLSLLESARWSPSCFNDQPWRFFVSVKANNEIGWLKTLSILSEKNQNWAKNAPVLMLAAAMENFSHNGNQNRHAHYDTGAACLSLCLQATALGLITHQMAGFSVDKARELFSLPADCSPLSMIAIGYQATPETLDEELKLVEFSQRSRKPLDQICAFDK